MTVSMTPLEEAAYVHERADHYDRQQKLDAAASLSEWGVFSLRQIAAIVGLAVSTVRHVSSPKSDRTGGRFDPACLPTLLSMSRRRARGEHVDAAEVQEMLAAGSGTSVTFAARLGGISEGYLRRRVSS